IRGFVTADYKLIYNANHGESVQNRFTHGPRNNIEEADPIVKDWRKDQTLNRYINRPEWELYNIDRDLGEQRNIAAESPKLEQLKTLLQNELQRFHDSPMQTEGK